MAAIASEVRGMKTGEFTLQSQYGSPSDFDARQRRFENRSSEIIRDASTKLKQALASGSDLIPFFHEMRSEFAAKRGEIAREEGAPDAHRFGGLYEDLEDGYYPYTELVGPYREANRFAVENLSKELASLSHDYRQFHETSKKIQEVVAGRHFSTEVKILASQDVAEWSHEVPREVVSKYAVPLRDANPGLTPIQLWGKYKEAQPKLYLHSKMHFHLMQIAQIFPSPKHDSQRTKIVSGTAANLKSEYVLVTKRVEIDGKMVSIGQQLTWVYRTFNSDPFQRMTNPAFQPVITVLHQDIFLHPISMNECARLFGEIMKLNPRDTRDEDLKNRVALLRYIFAVMPYKRGSAAIGEWIERTIYDCFGYSTTYQPRYAKESPDIIAINSLRYSEYLKRYKEIVQISKQ